MQSAPVNSSKIYAKIFGQIGWGLNLGLVLTQGVNRVYPEEMVELRRLVELTGVDCNCYVQLFMF